MSPTLTVRVSDSAGNETVATHTFQVASGETILTGDIGGLVAAGTTARLRGACRLVADLHVRGTLVADPIGVDLDGQGLWDIHTHDGGVLNLQGVEKTAWAEWGASVVGWQVGDLLAVAPTISSIVVAPLTWPGSWAAMTRPSTSPDVVLRDGRVMKPEVINLSQTLLIRNVTRIMVHESGGLPNVHTLKWLKILNSGKTSVLAFYPIHFHLLGETARGSLVEGVVVEGGKHHAFVPHGSHGITFRGCAAYKTVRSPYFWDPPESGGYVGGGVDPSNDVTYDHCLALVTNSNNIHAAGAFRLTEGNGNRMVGCRAVLTRFGSAATGVHWRFDSEVWEFSDYVGHNNGGFGSSVWQNTGIPHLLENMVGYQNATDYDHGAYGNLYHYRDIYGDRFVLHAKSEESPPGVEKFLTIERANLNVLEVTKHQLGRFRPTKVIDSQIGSVVYTEYEGFPSWIEYRDCGLTPADFTFSGPFDHLAGNPVVTGMRLTKIQPDSIIEIFESDVLVHRWSAGVWT